MAWNYRQNGSFRSLVVSNTECFTHTEGGGPPKQLPPPPDRDKIEPPLSLRLHQTIIVANVCICFKSAPTVLALYFIIDDAKQSCCCVLHATAGAPQPSNAPSRSSGNYFMPNQPRLIGLPSLTPTPSPLDAQNSAFFTSAPQRYKAIQSGTPKS